MIRPLLLAASLALAACASTPTYAPAASYGAPGYSETRVESNRYFVTYRSSGAAAHDDERLVGRHPPDAAGDEDEQGDDGDRDRGDRDHLHHEGREHGRSFRGVRGAAERCGAVLGGARVRVVRRAGGISPRRP